MRWSDSPGLGNVREAPAEKDVLQPLGPFAQRAAFLADLARGAGACGLSWSTIAATVTLALSCGGAKVAFA
jgi:hypothetical protein